MRTRILGKCLNSEVQEYLQRNYVIIIPVGTTEMHGGFPLDCETVISEAFCLKMLKEGLIGLIPGIYFGTEGYIRLSYCYSDEELRESLDRLEKFIRTL